VEHEREVPWNAASNLTEALNILLAIFAVKRMNHAGSRADEEDFLLLELEFILEQLGDADLAAALERLGFIAIPTREELDGFLIREALGEIAGEALLVQPHAIALLLILHQ
jgi:hypothetical protein